MVYYAWCTSKSCFIRCQPKCEIHMNMELFGVPTIQRLQQRIQMFVQVRHRTFSINEWISGVIVRFRVAGNWKHRHKYHVTRMIVGPRFERDWEKRSVRNCVHRSPRIHAVMFVYLLWALWSLHAFSPKSQVSGRPYILKFNLATVMVWLGCLQRCLGFPLLSYCVEVLFIRFSSRAIVLTLQYNPSAFGVRPLN